MPSINPDFMQPPGQAPQGGNTVQPAGGQASLNALPGMALPSLQGNTQGQQAFAQQNAQVDAQRAQQAQGAQQAAQLQNQVGQYRNNSGQPQSRSVFGLSNQGSYMQQPVPQSAPNAYRTALQNSQRPPPAIAPKPQQAARQQYGVNLDRRDRGY